jgi:hypothetical protein
MSRLPAFDCDIPMKCRVMPSYYENILTVRKLFPSHQMDEGTWTEAAYVYGVSAEELEAANLLLKDYKCILVPVSK